MNLNESVINSVPAIKKALRKVPLIQRDQVGKLMESGTSFETYVQTDLELGPNAFALELQGDEMPEDFKKGDLIIVDPFTSPLTGDFVIAKIGNETISLKKYRGTDRTDFNGNPIFELTGQTANEVLLSPGPDSIEVVGTMIEHRRYKDKTQF